MYLFEANRKLFRKKERELSKNQLSNYSISLKADFHVFAKGNVSHFPLATKSADRTIAKSFSHDNSC